LLRLLCRYRFYAAVPIFLAALTHLSVYWRKALAKKKDIFLFTAQKKEPDTFMAGKCQAMIDK
jgi:hypothetical protein